MLLTGTETLHLAARQGWALPAFAVYNLEMIQAIVTAAEEAGRPVLLLADGASGLPPGQLRAKNHQFSGPNVRPMTTEHGTARGLLRRSW
jgi:hypothetical protein